MFLMLYETAIVALSLGGAQVATASNLPTSIMRQIPSGFDVMTSAATAVGARRFQFVALRSRKELTSGRYLTTADAAPARPLLIFQRRSNGDYVAVGRNDKVIATADAGGLAGNGCDPFENHRIAIKGSYFTVENDVSCGAHWTDYITFRFEPRVGGYVFDNERFESWKSNPSRDPNGSALVRDAERVWRAPRGRSVTFSRWRPRAR